MKGAQSISTRRAYGVQRICRVWGRARSSVYARRHATRARASRRRGPVGVPKGGYDVHDAQDDEVPATTPAV